jgi:hypothetical protein
VNGVKEVVGWFEKSGAPSAYLEESGSQLLSPDVITPAQYYSSPSPTPYHRLLLAVLEDAIRCFQRNLSARRGPRRLLFREVKEWLFDPNCTGFMSFAVVCENLGIEADLLRRQLRQWQIRNARGLQVPRLGRRTPLPADKPIT